MVSRNFQFSRRYSWKMCVRAVVDYADTVASYIVNDYADTMSAWFLATLTHWKLFYLWTSSQRLCRHNVSVVNTFADMMLAYSQWLCGHGEDSRTLLENFEGFSQIVKVFGCVYNPNSNNLKYEHLRISNFAIEYLCEMKYFVKLFLPVHMGRIF